MGGFSKVNVAPRDTGTEVDNLTTANVACPLVPRRQMGELHQQPIHVCNGCISDDPDRLPYVKVGTVNYHSTGHHLEDYQSLHSTSKAEAVHLVLNQKFYSRCGLEQKYSMHVWDRGFWDTIIATCVLFARRLRQTPCH